MSTQCSGKCVEKRWFAGTKSMYQASFSSTEDFPRQICWRETNVTELSQTMRLHWIFKTCYQFFKQSKHAALKQTLQSRVRSSYFDRLRHFVTVQNWYMYGTALFHWSEKFETIGTRIYDIWYDIQYDMIYLLTLRRLMSYIYIYIYIWSTHSWCF